VVRTIYYCTASALNRGVNEYDDAVLAKLEQVDKKAYWSAKGENALRKRYYQHDTIMYTLVIAFTPHWLVCSE
jgi:hypothetical protein